MSYWRNQVVVLRAFEESDAAFFYETLNRYDMQYGNCDIRFPASMKSAENIVAGCAERDNREVDNQFMVIEDLAHNAVGMIDTHNCDTKTGYFEYGISILPQYRRKGYATNAIRLLLKFMFEECRFEKANAMIYSFNGESAALHEKMGFIKEGIIRRNVYTGGVYYDTIVYGMTRQEYLDLAGRNNNLSGWTTDYT